MLRCKLYAGIVMAGVATLGCEPSATPPTTLPQASSPAVQPGHASDAPPPASAQTPPTQPAEVRVEEPVVAKAGVAKQGQSLRNEQGIGRMIAQPAITLFTVRERAVFEIQIPSAMNLFNATEGRAPKNHDEFMTKIINQNQIKLPELPAGKTYQYHPEDAQLWVHPTQ
jgi:hypothetical protein